MDYAKSIQIDLDYQEAVAQVKAAFKEQGFGTLTEIDMKATLKEKIGAEIEDYVILGTCNPDLANRALAAEKNIGLLLPCSVIVRREGSFTTVTALDPQIIASVPNNPSLEPIAQEAGTRIQAALDKINSTY